jgi:hypothetical protein
MRVPRSQPPPVVPPIRKDLNADALFRTVKSEFEAVADPRSGSVTISLADALMSAFAMFSLKDRSLLAFEQRRLVDPNLHAIYGIENVPSDTQMRVICDGVLPDLLRPVFRSLFRTLQRGKELAPFVFLDGHYLVSLDGTGFYSSEKLGSAACLIKTDKKTGTVTYQLQMLGAALVHPDRREVLALFPEMIRNEDGQTKNDCERNAARRWLPKFRRDHPHLSVIVTEDALAPNAPHIRDLQQHNCRFLLGVKPGDHALLFAYVDCADREGLVTHHERPDPVDPKITHRFRFLDEVPLNRSNLDVLVSFVEYWQIDPNAKPTQHFAWVTDLCVTIDNLYAIMRGARARWRIENETFNTLKNQGYHLGHNYGLGENHLASVFATLMMLAFLVDQVQQHGCTLFQAVGAKLGSNRALWEAMRSVFRYFVFDSMTALYVALLQGIRPKPPELLPDTS